MHNLKKIDVFTTGSAIFAMFFGAGNIIFPLVLGQYALNKTPYAIAGLLLTAVLMPFAGLLAMFLYKGETSAFFGRMGKIPGLLVAFIVMALLGPLGSTPRCIALAYATFKLSYPELSPTLFSLGVCILIFFAVYNKNRLLSLLGNILTPILLCCLTFIIIKGFLYAPESATSTLPESDMFFFWHGLKEGYNTMDLLAAFFFAPVILTSIYERTKGASQAELSRFILKSSALGAVILSIVYICFSYLASYYASSIGEVSSDKILASIAIHILGPKAGFIVNLIIALACLTTAIALIAAFCQFLQKDIFHSKANEKLLIIGSLAITFIVANFEFSGISAFLTPVLQICYPGLILLTLLNICHRLYQFKTVKVPMLGCFILTLCSTYLYTS